MDFELQTHHLGSATSDGFRFALTHPINWIDLYPGLSWGRPALVL